MPLLSKVLKANSLNQAGCQQLPLLELVKTEADVKQPMAEMAVDHSAQAKKMLAEAQNQIKTVQAECEKMLQEAEKKKEELLSAAQEEAEAIKIQAQREGYDKGLSEGLLAGKQESQKLCSEAEEMLAAAKKYREQMLTDLEPQVVELAVVIAQKFVAAERLANPQILQEMIQQALQQLQETGEIVIRLHPADMKQGRETLPDWQAEMGEHCNITLLPDPSLGRGDCRVESNSQVISCLLDERFAALRELLTEVKANASA
jgi:flagellar assembly protein FliH